MIRTKTTRTRQLSILICAAATLFFVTGCGGGSGTESVSAPVSAGIGATAGRNPANVINSAIASAVELTIDVSADAAAGETLSVTLSDGALEAASPAIPTTVGGGSVLVGPIDASALADGTIEVHVTVTSGSSQFTTSFGAILSKDTVAPILPLLAVIPEGEQDAPNPEGVINQNNEDTVTVHVDFDASASSADLLSIICSDGQTSIETVQQNAIPGGQNVFTSIDLSSLTDGPVSITVLMVDSNDNFSSWQGAAEKDVAIASVNSAWIASTPANAQGVVNSTTEGAVTVQIELGDEALATDLVTVEVWSDADATYRILSPAQNAVEGGGTMLFEGLDLSDLSDGNLTCQISITDVNQNAANASGDPALLDTTLTTASSVGVSAGTGNAANVVNTSNIATAEVLVDFGSTASAAGDTLEVFVDHAGGSLSSGLITLPGGEFTHQVTFDLTGIAEGNLVTRAISGDSAGNTFEGGGFNLIFDATPPAGHTSAFVAATAGNPQGTVIQVNDSAAVIAVDVVADSDSGRSIQVQISDGSTTISSSVETASTSGGMMQFAAMDLSGLQEGSLTINAIYTDSAGNSITQMGTSAIHDVSVPTPSTGSVSAGASNAANTVNASNVSGVTATINLPAGTSNSDLYQLRFKAPGQISDSIAISAPAGGGIVTFPAMDVSTLPDGMITMTVIATDIYGNMTSWAGPLVSKDTVAPGSPATAYVLSGVSNAVNEINSSNAATTGARVQMSAASGSDETVSVTLRDSAGASINSTSQLTNGPGAFIDFLAINASGLTDGNIDVIVNISDAAGNATTWVVATALKSTQAVVPTSAVVASGPSNPADIINISSVGTVQIDVAMPVASLATDLVTVTLNGGGSVVSAGQAAPLGGGIMSFIMDASTLSDGSVAITVDVFAASTNTSTFTGSPAMMDTVAPTTPTSAIVPAGLERPANAINALSASAVLLEMAWPTGADAADQVAFEMTDGAASVNAATFSPMPGTTQGHTHDLSALADGPITLNVVVTDAAGNTSAFTGSPVAKDVVAPVAPSAGGIGAGASNAADYINISNATSAGVTLTWPAGAVATDLFTVTIVDGLGASIASANMNPTPGASTWTSFDTSSLADGPITFKVDMFDTVGNMAPFSPNAATKDTIAPTPSLGQIVAVGASNPANWVNGTSETLVMVDVTFGGGSQSSETATVWLSGGAQSTATLQQATPAGAGVLAFGPFDASALADGSVKVFVDIADAAGNTAQSFGSASKDSVAPTTPTSMFIPAALDLPANYINILSQSAAFVEMSWPTGSDAADQVTLDITDGTSTVSAAAFSPMPGTTQGYTFDLSSLADGGVALNMQVTDAAGNVSVYVGSPIAKDTVAPAAPTSGGIGAGAGNAADFINISNAAAAGVELFWPASAEATDYYTITITDGTSATIVSGNLNPTPGAASWASFDTTALVDGPISFKVDLFDPAGNPAPFMPNAAAKDTVAPIAALSQTVALGGSNPLGYINASSESAVMVDVSFDAASAATETATVWLDDGSQQTATIALSATAGAGTLSFGPFNAAALADGSVKVFVDINDAAGNSISTFNTATKDSVAPDAPTIAQVKVGPSNAADIINVASVAAVTVEVTWGPTADAAADAFVTLGGSLSSATSNPTPGAAQSWLGLDASALADGPVTVDVTVTDVAGNATTFAGTAATKDTITPEAPTALTVKTGPSNATDIINIASAGAVTVEATWAATADATADAFVTLGGSTISATGNPTPGANQDWAGLDASAVADGPVTVVMTVTDAAGNATTFAGIDATKDTVAPDAPTIAQVKVGPSNAADIINTNSVAAVTVEVTWPAGADATADAFVTVGGSLVSATQNPTAGAAQDYAGFDCSAQAEGSITVDVSVTDAAGNPTTFVGTTATKDTTLVAASSASIPATAGNNTDTISSATAAAVTVDVTFPATADGTESATIDLTGGATVTSVSQPIPAGGGVVTFAAINCSTLTDGAINVTVNVTDANQNTASAVTLVATMDTATPALPTTAIVAATVNNPQDFINATTASSVTVELTFPASSNADDLATVTLSDGALNAVSTPVNAPAGGGTVQVLALNTSAFADGAVTVSVDMVDGSLNASGPFAGTSATQDVVAPADPTVDPITSPTNQAAQTITGTADVSTSIIIDGGAAQATGTSNAAGAFALSTTLAATATNNLTVYAEDAAGNRSAGQTVDYNTAALSILQDPTAADAPFTNATATYFPVNSNGAADGGAFADFDGDGDLDLFVASAASGILYQYDSVAGQFNDISVSAGGPFTGDVCAIWGDYDNDGDLDLLTVDAVIGSTLYRNDIIGLGTTTFTDVTAAELAGVTGTLSQAFWLDYDNDGFLDFLVVNSDGAGNYLMQNQRGQGVPSNTFVRDSAAGIDAAGTSKFWGAVCDFDVDGDADVVYGGATPGYFWQNSGAATFADIAGVTSNVTWDHSAGGRGTAWVDYDNDGDFDLYIARGAAGPFNQLWRNDGGGSFTEVAALAGLDTDVDADDICWGDVNNDGFIDLYVGSNTTNRLYLGLGDTNADTVFEFSEVSVASTVNDAGDAGMVQMGDVDGDGDLELFVGNEGAFDVLYDNDLNNFNYLKVIVAGQGTGAGTASADGRGAIVTLKDSTGTITLATREINGGRGAGSQDTEHCHFGGVTPSLGYTVEVRFPSGAVVTQVVTPRFAPNHTVTISE